MGAMHNAPPAYAEWLQKQRGAVSTDARRPLDNVMRTKQLSRYRRSMLLKPAPKGDQSSAERGPRRRPNAQGQ